MAYESYGSSQWFQLRSVSSTDNLSQIGGSVITSLAYDTLEELLWAGSEDGYVTGYQYPGLEKYSCFHSTIGTVHQIIPQDFGILCVGGRGLRLFERGGVSIARFQHDTFKDLHAACGVDPEVSRVFLGGDQEELLIYDLTKQRILKTVTSEHNTMIMRRGRLLVCGSASGKIVLRDPSSLKVEQILDAHTGALSDCDLSGNTLVTCGYSGRGDQLVADPFIKVYDVRTFRPLPLLSFHSGQPALLRFHPTLTSTLAAASQHGLFQVLDVTTGIGSILSQVDCGDVVTTLDVAPSGETMAFGDAIGLVHQWADREECKVNPFSRPTPMVPPYPAPPTYNLTERDPLSLIGMPWYDEGPLLSDWPTDYRVDVGLPPRTIDSDILADTRQTSFIGHAPNPRTRKRNQAPGAQERIHAWAGTTDKARNVPSSPNMVSSSPVRKGRGEIAKNYRLIEVHGSKLEATMQDFNAGAYNKTKFGCLENGIPNSYCNPLLQVLYFTPAIRGYCMAHSCEVEYCMTCELGFLFHMLDLARGQNTQASNFTRTVRHLKLATALALLEENPDAPDKSISYPELIERFNRFVVQQIGLETAKPNPGWRGPPITDLVFGAQHVTRTVCQVCNTQTERTALTHNVDFAYPTGPSTFGQALANSLRKVLSLKVWCEKCNAYQPVSQTKSTRSLPNVLSLNVAPTKPEEMDIWDSSLDPSAPPQSPSPSGTGNDDFIRRRGGRARSWLPLRVRITLGENDTVTVEELQAQGDDDTEPTSSRDATDADLDDVYELSAVVANVQKRTAVRPGHLVAHIRVPGSYHARAGSTPNQRGWHLFNDFLVTGVPPSEVTDFDATWKSPCLLFFTRVKRDARLDEAATMPVRIPPEVLLAESTLASKRKKSVQPLPRPPPLSIRALPQAGDLIALDSEFVEILPEETEVRSDGTRHVVRPRIMAVARISCIGGSGKCDGVVVMDDYLVCPDPVSDYLTKYSGISPGDLDPTVSRRHVTTLKSTYLKLRYLIDTGCIMVGHGLKKDFRMMNVVVPAEQIVDTVEIFSLKKQRKVGLRFLAAFLIKLDVQSGMHDSLEDSRAALAIYRSYQQLVAEGKFETTLQELYRIGRRHNWMPEALLNPAPGAN